MWGGVSNSTFFSGSPTNQPFGTGWWHCREAWEAFSAHGLVAPIWLIKVWLGHKEVHHESARGLVVWCWWVFNGLKYRFFFSRNVFFNPFDFSDMWLRGYDLVALWRRCWSFCSLKKQGEREVFCVLVSLSTWSFMFPWFGVFENVNVMLELELFISPMIKTPFFRG